MAADPKDKMGKIARGFAKAKEGKPSEHAILMIAKPEKSKDHGKPGAYCNSCGKPMDSEPSGAQLGNLGAGGDQP